MKYTLYRSLGKRSWDIGYYNSVQQAESALIAHVEDRGHLYPNGTKFFVRYNLVLGEIVDGKLDWWN